MEAAGVKVDDHLRVTSLVLKGWVLLEPHSMGQEQPVTVAPSTVSVLNIQIGLCCHPFYGVGVDSHLVPP